MSEKRSIDTAPHPEFPCYSSGNFGEIAPERWSVMSWSLVGDPVERGLRAFTRRLWPSARWVTGSHYVFVGYFRCRPYHNLSALCQIAAELPGLTAEDVTRAYFEGEPAPHAQMHTHAPGAQRLLSLPRMARELHRLRPRLAWLEGVLACSEERLATALASGSPVALGRWVEEANGILDQAWDLHYSTTSALIPAGVLQRILGERRLSHWAELEPLVTRPGDVVWGRLSDGAAERATAAGFLDRPFYEVADEHEPWRTYARAFAPQPAQEVPRVASADELSEVVWRMQRRARRIGAEQASWAVVDSMRAREESKALAMRCLHAFRQALPALAGEANLDGDAWSYLRIQELLDPSCRAHLAALAERRRRECEEALSEPMPDRLVLDAATPNADPPAAAKAPPPRRSSGVSPGVVAGVVATPADAPFGARDPERPIVLVCESADAGLQGLLPTVAGLITRRGSALSHISTLAREYGIPAVVNHPLAGTLRTGQHVVLNGSTGEVEVIE